MTIDPVDLWRMARAQPALILSGGARLFREATGVYSLEATGVRVSLAAGGPRRQTRAAGKGPRFAVRATSLPAHLATVARETWESEPQLSPDAAGRRFAQLLLSACTGLEGFRWGDAAEVQDEREELARLISSAITDGGQVGGAAPVLFLRTVSENTAAPRAQARCVFATDVPDDSGGSRGGSGGRLSCSLGRDGMPFTCALYPLGSMWAAAGRGSSSDSDGPQRIVYSLDTGGCEGAAPASPSSESPAPSSTTVAAYAAKNDLGLRHELAERHRLIATLTALLSPDQMLAAAWDALDLDPGVPQPQDARLRRTTSRPPTAEAAAVVLLKADLGLQLAHPERVTPDDIAGAVQRRVREIWWPALWPRGAASGGLGLCPSPAHEEGDGDSASLGDAMPASSRSVPPLPTVSTAPAGEVRLIAAELRRFASTTERQTADLILRALTAAEHLSRLRA